MELARAQLQELKAEIEFERRLRRKAESLSRALAQELSAERAEREASEREREVFADALVKEREEVKRVMEEVEEERRRMRVAEVMREERVRMKMLEAKIVMEEKLREMEEVRELRDAMGVSLSVIGLYGEFDFSMELAEASEFNESKIKRGRVWPLIEAAGPSSSSTSLCERGKRSLACKEMEYEQTQLRMLLLRDKKDYML